MKYNLEQERKDSEHLVELANRLGDRGLLKEAVELGREKWKTLAAMFAMTGAVPDLVSETLANFERML